MSEKTAITLKKEIAGLLTSRNVGNGALILEDKDVLLLLRAAIKHEGSISAFARRHRLERSHVTNMLNGKRPVSGLLVKAMGLRKVYTPDVR
jgi:hypothetical protein